MTDWPVVTQGTDVVRESIEDVKRTPLSLRWFAVKLRSLVYALVVARRTNGQ